MNTYSRGSIRKVEIGKGSGKWCWQGVVTITDADGKRHHKQKNLRDDAGNLIEASPDKGRDKGTRASQTGKGSDKAKAALESWRQSLKDDEAKQEADAKAAAERAKAEEEARRKAKQEALAKRHMLWAVIDEYVETRFHRQSALEASTYTDYKKCVARIHETLPDRPVEELTERDVEEWDALMYGTDKEPGRYALATANKTRVILRASMKYAHEHGMVRSNPVRLRVKPKKERREDKNDDSRPKFNALDKRNRSVLLSELEGVDEDFRPVAVAASIALLSGLREGECCGLLWSDVDIAGGIINVSHAVGLGEGGAYLKMPKNDLTRPVPIAPELVPILRRWRAECEEANMPFKNVASLDECFVLGDPTKPVDPDRVQVPFDPMPLRGAGNMNPATLSRKWRSLMSLSKARGYLGDRPSFHNLRHSYACATANELGMPKEDLAKILGHGDVKTTEKYYLRKDDEQERKRLRAVMDRAYENGSMLEPVGDVEQLRAV